MENPRLETVSMLSNQYQTNDTMKTHFHESKEIIVIERHYQQHEQTIYHHDALVLFVCRTGHLRLKIKDKNYELYAGDVIVIPYMTLFQCEAPETTHCDTLYLSGRYIVQNIAWFPYINDAFQFNDAHLLYVYEQIVLLMDRSLRIDRDGFNAYLQIFFYEMYQKLPEREKEKTPKWQGYFPKSFTDMLLFVHKHYTEPITLADLEQRFNVSAQHIGRLFQRYVHVTYKSYVDTLRLEHAVFLLQNTQMPILKIVYEAGYPNKQSFAKAMKVAYGCTPSRFRSR